MNKNIKDLARRKEKLESHGLTPIKFSNSPSHSLSSASGSSSFTLWLEGAVVIVIPFFMGLAVLLLLVIVFLGDAVRIGVEGLVPFVLFVPLETIVIRVVAVVVVVVDDIVEIPEMK